MLNTSNVPNGGRFHTRFSAMTVQPKKLVFDRWAKRIGALYIAVAALLIAVATIAVPTAEKSATASLRAASVHITTQAIAKAVPSRSSPEVPQTTTAH